MSLHHRSDCIEELVYEFLVYRLLRNRLEAGDLFCRDSVHFRSFEDDLLDDHQWANKDVLIAQTGLAILAQPIQDRLAELKCQKESRRNFARRSMASSTPIIMATSY